MLIFIGVSLVLYVTIVLVFSALIIRPNTGFVMISCGSSLLLVRRPKSSANWRLLFTSPSFNFAQMLDELIYQVLPVSYASVQCCQYPHIYIGFMHLC